MAKASSRAIFLGGLALMTMILVLNQKSNNYSEKLDSSPRDLQVLKDQRTELLKIQKKLRDIGDLQVQQYFNDIDGGDTCQPTMAVAFAKTHKTGGSTIQNIFLRYRKKYNLIF